MSLILKMHVEAAEKRLRAYYHPPAEDERTAVERWRAIYGGKLPNPDLVHMEDLVLHAQGCGCLKASNAEDHLQSED